VLGAIRDQEKPTPSCCRRRLVQDRRPFVVSGEHVQHAVDDHRVERVRRFPADDVGDDAANGNCLPGGPLVQLSDAPCRNVDPEDRVPYIDLSS